MKGAYYFYRIVLLVFITLMTSCSAQKDNDKILNENETDVSSDKEAILFIGNSHTYYNQGVSTHLSKFRANDNLEFEPLFEEAAHGGYSLQDHLGDPSTIAKIKERAWDVLVLQENTSVAAETLPSTTAAMIAISDMVAQHDTKVFLYMTWPYKDFPEMLSGIKNTYETGATATKGTLVTIGEEWLAVHTNNEVSVNLYDDDGIHPSLQGTFFASAKFYRAIYGKSPSDNLYQAGLGAEVANYLKTKAN